MNVQLTVVEILERSSRCGTINTMTEPTRWLTEDEQESWRSFLFATQLLMESMDRQLQTEAGMAHSHYGILVNLSEAPDQAMRMTELATRLRFSQSRLTHAVTRLEGDGWVERAQCPTDRRGQIAVLTETGRQALVAVAPGHVAEVRKRVFDRLTAEQSAQLGEICQTILAGFEASCSPEGTRELSP